jgi:hypothetical protein
VKPQTMSVPRFVSSWWSEWRFPSRCLLRAWKQPCRVSKMIWAPDLTSSFSSMTPLKNSRAILSPCTMWLLKPKKLMCFSFNKILRNVLFSYVSDWTDLADGHGVWPLAYYVPSSSLLRFCSALSCCGGLNDFQDVCTLELLMFCKFLCVIGFAPSHP